MDDPLRPRDVDRVPPAARGRTDRPHGRCGLHRAARRALRIHERDRTRQLGHRLRPQGSADPLFARPLRPSSGRDAGEHAHGGSRGDHRSHAALLDFVRVRRGRRLRERLQAARRRGGRRGRREPRLRPDVRAEVRRGAHAHPVQPKRDPFRVAQRRLPDIPPDSEDRRPLGPAESGPKLRLLPGVRAQPVRVREAHDRRPLASLAASDACRGSGLDRDSRHRGPRRTPSDSRASVS